MGWDRWGGIDAVKEKWSSSCLGCVCSSGFYPWPFWCFLTPTTNSLETKWVSNNWIQSRCYLPKVRSHKIEGSVPQDCPQYRGQLQVLDHFHIWQTSAINWGCSQPPLRFDNFLKGSQNSQKHFTYVNGVIIKDTTQPQLNRRDS